MKKLSDYLYYLPSTQEPLSADAFFIAGQHSTYVFDVGSSQEALDAITALPGPRTFILSHPHRDHIGNLDQLDAQSLYVGDATYEKLKKGTVVTDTLTIRDGIELCIRPCPSPHTAGSLIVTVNNEYTLLADLYFCRPEHDRALAHSMLDLLWNIPTRYFVVSHQQEEAVFEREAFLNELSAYFDYLPAK